MIGKLLGALAGRSIARRQHASGAKGALIGAGMATLMRRTGPLGVALMSGIAAKRYLDRRKRAGRRTR